MRHSAVPVASAFAIAFCTGSTAAQPPGLAPSPAVTDTPLIDDLIACHALREESDRLDCYDALVAPLAGVAANGEAALYEFVGRDNWQSEPFETEGPWRVLWEGTASLLTIELQNAEGQPLTVVGHQIGEGGGRSEVIRPGHYRLAMRASGVWRVRVVGEGEE